MSLKAFHIVFITVSVLFTFGFGAWGLWGYFSGQGGSLELGLGIGSLVSGVALLIYGKYFLKKFRNVSYL